MSSRKSKKKKKKIQETAMREHTITKIRDLLASDDHDALSGLKEKQDHRFRDLSERAMSKSQSSALARLTANSDPKRILNRGFWQDVAQLVTRGDIDLSAMKPLFAVAPRSASSIEKLGVVAPGAAKAVISGLRGLKKLKSAFSPPEHEREPSVFNTKDDSFDVCSKHYPVGSQEYYKCMASRSHRGYGGYGHDDFLEIPIHGLRDKRGTDDLSQAIQSKLLQFGSARALAAAFAKLK